jgi:arylformamidase
LSDVADRVLYDITRPLDASMPAWPGDPAPQFDWVARRAAGDPVNLSVLHLSVHSGTHADAPYHVRDDGARIGAVGLDRFIGAALVSDTDGGTITADLVREVLRAAAGVDRILFRTGAWKSPDAFPADFPGFEPAAARLLAEARVLLVGTDAPSVDPFGSTELPAHHELAGAGIPILENLLLDGVPEGVYELIALPPRLPGADGSPIRAILRTR